MLTRREWLQRGGALIVSFSAAYAQGPFDTHNSHIDPKKLDSWLAVSADGSVTAHTGKCDLGQGIYTAQTQLVAEELCVPLSRVKLIQCDTAITPDQGTTSGSQSTPTNFNTQNLALAAATAREALLQLAAKRLTTPADQLTVAEGVIRNNAGKQVAYAELVGGRHFDLPLNTAAKRRNAAEWTVLGKPAKALELPALVTGQFEYVQSIRVPGMLHGRVVRPQEMGATLLSVDRESIRDIPGVEQVVVRKNWVGVVADTQHHATLAASKLAVKWNSGPELPAQNTFYDYLKKQPSRDSLSVDSQDMEKTVANGDLRRAQYVYPYQMHGSVGPSCAVADVKDGKATVWSPTQSVYPTRSVIAKLLDLPLENVRVIFTRGSGCYGLNGADAASFDAAILSHAVGRPVRLQFTRQDEMMWENLGAAVVVEHRATLSRDGRITAWDRENWVASLGNRPGYDMPGNVITGMLVGYEPDPLKPGPAKPPTGKLRNQSNTVPAYLAGCIEGNCGGTGNIRSERVLTHTVRSPFFTGPLRSPLRIQNTFANECFMDELCFSAKADPVEFRLKHLTDARLRAVVQAAAKAANWQPRPFPASTTPHRSRMQQGRGIACVDYEGGNGYAALIAEVTVDADTGVVRPKRFFVAIDAGPVSNPDGLRNQTEGGILQGMSRALVEQVTWDRKRITSVDWETYHSLYLDYEIPSIETVIMNPGDVPALGAGETAITVVPAAIGNAIFDACGVRLREVPFTPERVKAALAKLQV